MIYNIEILYTKLRRLRDSIFELASLFFKIASRFSPGTLLKVTLYHFQILKVLK